MLIWRPFSGQHSLSWDKYFISVINGILDPKVTILSSFTPPYVILNLFDFLLQNIKNNLLFYVLEQHEDEKMMTDPFKRMSYNTLSFNFRSVKSLDSTSIFQ